MASKAAAPALKTGNAKPFAIVAKRETSASNYVAIVAVVTLLVVLVCGFIGRSLVASIILDGKLIVHTNQAKSDLNTKLNNIPQLISNYNQLGAAKQQLIADALPNTADFPAMITIAQEMSTDSGVALKSLAPDATAAATTAAPAAPAAASTSATAATTPAATSPGTASTYDVDIEIDGTYTQVVHFFQDVELSAQPMKVVSAQISGDGTALDVSMVLQTYYAGPASTSDQTGTIK